MESLIKLEQINSILEKSFFEEHLDSFWGVYQQYYGCLNKKWDGRDSYFYTMYHVSYEEKVKYSLSDTLREDVTSKFKHLEKAFLNDIIQLDEEFQNNLIQIIRQKLVTIKLEANNLSLPQDYELIIFNHFTDCEKRFIKLLDDYNYPRISEQGFFYRKIHLREGKVAFKAFYNKIIYLGFISKDISERELFDLFSQRKSPKKIVWGGLPEEAHYFFTSLAAKEFIEIKSVWITVDEHFLIAKKKGGYFQMEKMRGLPTLHFENDKNKRKEINSLIEILAI